MFIVFDGPDGSGKSTLLKRTANRLQGEIDYNIVTTKEPGGTELGQDIREILLSPDKDYDMCNRSKLLLFLADRAQHFEEVIKPNLRKDNTILLSDRYWETSLVYQVIVPALDKQTSNFDLISRGKLNEFHDFVAEGIKPDLFYLITSKRAHSLKGDKHDLKGNDFRTKVKNIYDDVYLRKNGFNLKYQMERVDTTNKNWDQYLDSIVNRIKLQID